MRAIGVQLRRAWNGDLRCWLIICSVALACPAWTSTWAQSEIQTRTESRAETAIQAATQPATQPAAPAATQPEPIPGPLSQAQHSAIHQALRGIWITSIGDERIRLIFINDRECTIAGQAARYAIARDSLWIQSAEAESTYQMELAGDDLTLSGGDLSRPLKFTRLPQVTDYQDWFMGFSPARVFSKLKRIGMIIVIAVAAWMLIKIVKAISRFIILSKLGPLSVLYRKRKNRAMTVHSLVLNGVKYVVYFTAFGMILNEIGVNYTTYLASLSVIGLAVGFGSQGLVQDMVTGFFVVFEGQYDVDDMVEISGQIGIVEELGLRMTRLRNYLGQTVVIPNRNIALVGNFYRGAQHVRVDVAVRSEDVQRAARLVQLVAEEVAKQFAGAVMRQSIIGEPVTLATGEAFLRLELSIWPGQPWVIEQQLVPRIREAFGRAQLEIPNERVTWFSHARQQVEVSAWMPQHLLRRWRRSEKKDV